MPNIKTAISIEEPLFKEVVALAKEMKVSRSRLFSLAVSDFVQRQKNKKLVEAINAAYDDLPDEEEKKLLKSMKAKFRDIVDEW
jgi:metal-responsive CopG/Arc/MetJ family transcriptional regulator